MAVTWTDPMGLKMVYSAIAMMVLGALWMRKIVRVRVKESANINAGDRLHRRHLPLRNGQRDGGASLGRAEPAEVEAGSARGRSGTGRKAVQAQDADRRQRRGKFAKLSFPAEGWENSPLRLRFLQAAYRDDVPAVLYFGAKTPLAVIFPIIAYL